MKTYCFKIYHRFIDSDDITYIGADTPLGAIRKLRESYGDVDYDFLGEE